MASYIGAIDQGTTSTRFIIFDHQGDILGIEKKRHREIFPKPGWVEYDPTEIWKNTCEVIHKTLIKSGIKGSQLSAVGIANQRETTVVWNKETGTPFHNAVSWQCTRSHPICQTLEKEAGTDRFRNKTGLPPATYFSGPKLMWILRNIRQARHAAMEGKALFGTIDSWLIWNLSGGPDRGVHVTDITNAARTLMMNLNSLEWDQDILNLMDIPPGVLPRIVPSIDPDIWAMTTKEGPFGAEIPLCAAVGDQQAALIGHGCFEAGEAKNTYGTGCFLLQNTGETPVLSAHNLLTSPAYQIKGRKPAYCLEGAVAVAGSLVGWFQENLGIINSPEEIERLAAGVEDNGDVYFVPAFSGLFAPYWRPDARGVIVGLTQFADKGHLARAILEAVCYQTKDIVEAMKKDTGKDLKFLEVDGGMVENDLLMQFQADILNVPVRRKKHTEITAIGAAYAAGLAVGYWSGVEELRSHRTEEKIWKPGLTDSQRRRYYQKWKDAVKRSFDWEK